MDELNISLEKLRNVLKEFRVAEEDLREKMSEISNSIEEITKSL